MSEYDHKSIYSIYRSSVFASPAMQPSSIFTVCNVPSKEYDMSMDYNAHLVSVFFFKAVGTWIIEEQITILDSIEKLK